MSEAEIKEAIRRKKMLDYLYYQRLCVQSEIQRCTERAKLPFSGMIDEVQSMGENEGRLQAKKEQLEQMDDIILEFIKYGS